MASLKGPDLLRVKGIVHVAGRAGPVVIHGVQHVFHPPVELKAWPDADRRTRIVFITRNIKAEALAQVLHRGDDRGGEGQLSLGKLSLAAEQGQALRRRRRRAAKASSPLENVNWRIDLPNRPMANSPDSREWSGRRQLASSPCWLEC